MEENNRINRRSRPRPYDLRRKVLLKNFLREQMTFIPAGQIEPISQNEDVNNVEEPTMSLHFDEDLPELNDENSSSTVVVNEQLSSDSSDSVDPTPVIIDPKGSVLESVNPITDVNTSSGVNNESSVYKFASLIKHKRDSKKKQKGIVKAKEALKSAKSPTKSRTFKSGLERVFNRHKKPSESSSQSTKSKIPPRSLFSLFKHRKAQRNANEIDKVKKSSMDNKSNSVRTKCPTSNQSVQTDDTWAREELYKVQQSNRLLREENRLLSESLSYFMSSSSMDSQINHCSSPLQSSNKNVFNSRYHDYFPSSNSSSNWNPRSRISRSKSVHEHSERRNILRNNYRTRSVNCHSVRNKFLLPDPKPLASAYSTQSEGYNIPRVRRKNILVNLPVNSSVRGIQRRSSMPERILSENDRSTICRRSESFRDTYRRKPFYSLPSEAFY